MNPTQCLFAKVAIRVVQACCLILVLSVLADLNSLFSAVSASWQGMKTVPELCWNILAFTGPLIPALICLFGAQFTIPRIVPPTHNPSEPWLANPMWAEKHIRLSNRGLVWTMSTFFLCYLGIIVPFAIATEKTPFLVFSGAMGLVLLLIARVFWRNRKWNTAELRMAAVPGVIGGPFAGVVILQQAFPQGTPFDVCLKCQRTTRHQSTRGNKESTSTTETVWSSTISIDKPLPPVEPNRTFVPFTFGIPFDCDPSSTWSDSSATSTHWTLVIQQRGKPELGAATFSVPIFRTPESSADFALDAELIAPFEQVVDLESVLSRLQCKRELLADGGKRFVFTLWNQQSAFAVSIMSLICSAIIVALFWFVPNFYGAAFAAIFPGIFLLLGLYVLLEMLFWKSSIEIDGQGLRCISGWQGFRQSMLVTPLENSTFISKFDSRKENGEWYRVELCALPSKHGQEPDQGSALTVVKRLDGRAEADAVADWLCQEAKSR
jgi:hypothetical protein